MDKYIQICLKELAELVRIEGMLTAILFTCFMIVTALFLLMAVIAFIVLCPKFSLVAGFIVGLVYSLLKYAVEKESK